MNGKAEIFNFDFTKELYDMEGHIFQSATLKVKWRPRVEVDVKSKSGTFKLFVSDLVSMGKKSSKTNR